MTTQRERTGFKVSSTRATTCSRPKRRRLARLISTNAVISCRSLRNSTTSRERRNQHTGEATAEAFCLVDLDSAELGSWIVEYAAWHTGGTGELVIVDHDRHAISGQMHIELEKAHAELYRGTQRWK